MHKWCEREYARINLLGASHTTYIYIYICNTKTRYSRAHNDAQQMFCMGAFRKAGRGGAHSREIAFSSEHAREREENFDNTNNTDISHLFECGKIVIIYIEYEYIYYYIY